MSLHDLWVALGLMAVLEGLLYAAFPEQMKRMMAQISQQPGEILRLTGLLVAITGVASLWLLERL
jgi:uncharacterized protein YjeT (DUF2065 family)